MNLSDTFRESDRVEALQKFISLKKIEAPLLLSRKPTFLPYFEPNESSHARKHARSRTRPLTHTYAHTRAYVYESSAAILASYPGLGSLISFFPSVIRNINIYTDYASLLYVLHYFSISVPVHYCLNIW
jgi:hypothetical protein